MFEALALGGPSGPAPSGLAPSTAPLSSTPAASERSMRFDCGLGALPQPRFARRRAAVCVHATSGITATRGDPDARPGDPISFEYQIVIENTGAVPVEVLGRCARPALSLCIASIAGKA
jgi:hypothetical protein